jgi:S-adenosylmethionine decarboxylase
MHLIIDGHGGEPQRLWDVGFIYQLLARYPSQIGMSRVSPPQVAKYSCSDSTQGGVSGFVLLAESHISIHTFPEQSYINIDVFSCKDFNPEQAIREFQQLFCLTEVRSRILSRPQSGLE